MPSGWLVVVEGKSYKKESKVRCEWCEDFIG